MTRKLTRAAELTRRWTGELARHPLLGPADLAAWLVTTAWPGALQRAGLPWLTFPATRWLRGRVGPATRVLEFGAGASTLFFARRAARVVSVEHDPGWHGEVLRRVAAAGLSSRVDLRLVPAEPGVRAGYQSTDAQFAGVHFSAYASFADACAPASFDLALIDGRARAACVRHAAPLIVPGGLLLLDDAERPEYAEAVAACPAPRWRAIAFDGPSPGSIWPCFKRTLVFVRNPAG